MGGTPWIKRKGEKERRGDNRMGQDRRITAASKEHWGCKRGSDLMPPHVFQIRSHVHFRDLCQRTEANECCPS